jgi:hypothetical protein
VLQAIETYEELLPFLAALAILDQRTVSSNQSHTNFLRKTVRNRNMIPVPKLPVDIPNRKHVLGFKLRKGIIVNPGGKFSVDQMQALAAGHHGLEPFVGSAKFSQGWTTYLYRTGTFDPPETSSTERPKPCTLFPGCEGVDEFGFPEADDQLAQMIIEGAFDLDFSEEELECARNAIAGDCDCGSLREKIWNWRREVSRCFDDIVVCLIYVHSVSV